MQRLHLTSKFYSRLYSEPGSGPLPHLFARWREDSLLQYKKATKNITYNITNGVRRGKVYISILGNGRWKLEES